MGKARQDPDHPLGRAVAGAIGGGVLWWALNGASTVNGVGWLTRAGPPWSWVALFAAVGGVLGGLIGLRAQRRRRAHAREVEAQSRGMGFSYDERADDLLDRYPGAAAMPVFRHWHSSADRAAGEVRGAVVEVFDLIGRRTSEGAEDSSTTTTRQTVVFLPGAGLPDFELTAMGRASRTLAALGIEGMTFDARDLPGDDARAVEAFVRLYRVDPLRGRETPDGVGAAPGDDPAIRRVFSPGVMRLFTARPGWSAQSSGGHIALWRGSEGGYGTVSFNGLTIPVGRKGGFVPAGGRAGMIEEVAALVEAMKAASPCPETAVPPRPAGVLASRRARATGGGLGAAGGGMFGFFGGFGAFASLMFSRKSPAMMMSMPVFLLGGGALGVLAGFILGRRFLPVPAVETPAIAGAGPSASKAWPILGTLAGFMLVGMLGMVGVSLLADGASFSWFAPILIFGGAGAGGGTGLILGGLFAQRRRDRPRPGRPAPPPGR